MSDTEESPTPAKVARLSSSITEVSSDPEPGSVDAETQKALEDIDCCQGDIDALNEKASEEILQVEMKYNKLRRPHFERRNNLIKHIPNFWVTSFLNHPRMANIVEEEEEECLHYLKQFGPDLKTNRSYLHVDVEEFEDIKSGYLIRFQFASNPYFTDEVLTKEFHLAATDGKPPTRSTQIHWKPNMDLTRNTQAKNVRRQRGEGRSFFSWLTDNVDPTRDRIAEMIKDDLWPNPLQYYLASDIEVEENGVDSDDDDDDVMEDDSVVIVGDDDDDEEVESDDDDVYEVKDDDEDDDDFSGEELEETVESIEVEDDDEDDDNDAIEVLGSDSEAELLNETSEISQDTNTSVSHTKNGDGKGNISQDENTGNEPDTSQTSELISENKSQSDNNTEDEESDALLNGDKNTTDCDDSVLDSDNLVSQNDDSVLLDNDENDSDLLKEDDDDDYDDTSKKEKDSGDTNTVKTDVVDTIKSGVVDTTKSGVVGGEEKVQDGVD